MATQTMAAPAAYPLRFDVQYPPQLNRWLIATHPPALTRAPG